MRREWEPEDLIACWKLVEADQELVANKSGATQLGFALLLKFFELRAGEFAGRFPATAELSLASTGVWGNGAKTVGKRWARFAMLKGSWPLTPRRLISTSAGRGPTRGV